MYILTKQITNFHKQIRMIDTYFVRHNMFLKQNQIQTLGQLKDRRARI